LNVRIQKSLILDFNERSARESAEQDWRIDLDRETTNKSGLNKKKEEEEDDEESPLDSDAESEAQEAHAQRKIQRKEAKWHKKSDKGIDYERLSEFFFDLCLSWCQYLDLETFLFFINGVFLNITRGEHISVSVFREIEDIPVLSIEFFNHLLAYRQTLHEDSSHGQTYADWYRHNFIRTH